MADLKPIDEKWMYWAMVFVCRFRKRNKTGPTWSELASQMGWKSSSTTTYYRMLKLVRRGLVYTEDLRSLDVSEEGRENLRVAYRETMR